MTPDRLAEIRGDHTATEDLGDFGVEPDGQQHHHRGELIAAVDRLTLEKRETDGRSGELRTLRRLAREMARRLDAASVLSDDDWRLLVKCRAADLLDGETP